MRFPFGLSRTLAAYLLKQKLAGRKRFPLVLMLEPLHACNLKCSGCGRIREYAESLGRRLSIDECLAAVDECPAPVVSVCGGEPLIYPKIEELVEAITARGRYVYLCTNGVKLAEALPRFRPNRRLFWNVHLDGMEATHDRIVERPGVFAAAVAGVEAAKRAGFLVYTNTTIYRQTDVNEIAVLFGYLAELGVDGMMISPSYGYDAVSDGELFMSREEIHAWFQRAAEPLRWFPLTATPNYLDFLRGQRKLTCAAWASPTRNVRGWKGPCYLLTDAHYGSYAELLSATDWESLGPGGDARCRDCLVHCGFEPAAVLQGNRRLADVLRMAMWQLG